MMNKSFKDSLICYLFQLSSLEINDHALQIDG